MTRRKIVYLTVHKRNCLLLIRAIKLDGSGGRTSLLNARSIGAPSRCFPPANLVNIDNKMAILVFKTDTETSACFFFA